MCWVDMFSLVTIMGTVERTANAHVILGYVIVACSVGFMVEIRVNLGHMIALP